MKPTRTIREVTQNDRAQWDTCVTHPLQSWSWGEFRTAMGIDVARLGVFENDELVDGWQIMFHRVPHTPWTIGYFPKGPKPTREMTDALMKLGKAKRAIFIQLEPNIRANFKFQILNFKLLYPSHHPLFTKYTFILDITKSEEDLQKAMHPKTRYNIRVAAKKGVRVQEDNSEAAFREYLRLTQETTDRQGFYAHNQTYHTRMWETMKQSGVAHLFTATYEGKTLAAWIVFAWGKTLYYPYGSSSRELREVMAPNLLLWEIIRWGKAHEFTSFDLWGAMGPNPDTNDPWYGFHRFKEGYRPELVEFIGSFDLIIRPVLYKLYTFADTVRWKLLHAKK